MKEDETGAWRARWTDRRFAGTWRATPDGVTVAGVFLLDENKEGKGKYAFIGFGGEKRSGVFMTGSWGIRGENFIWTDTIQWASACPSPSLDEDCNPILQMRSKNGALPQPGGGFEALRSQRAEYFIIREMDGNLTKFRRIKDEDLGALVALRRYADKYLGYTESDRTVVERLESAMRWELINSMANREPFGLFGQAPPPERTFSAGIEKIGRECAFKEGELAE